MPLADQVIYAAFIGNMPMAEYKRTFTVAGIGELLWDMLPTGRQMGGAPANFAYFARALGARGYVVSRVGADSLGRELLARLRQSGLDPRYVQIDRAHPTGTVEIILDSRGKPAYDIKRGVAWEYIAAPSASLALAGRLDAVCYGTLAQRSPASRAAIRRFIRHTRLGALRVFDVNLRQSFYSRAVVETLMRMSNVLKLNDEELPVISALLAIHGGRDRAVKRLMRRYALRLVALTLGARGAVLYTPDGAWRVSGISTRVADTVGAGDAFTAALVMGLLGGMAPDAIGALANRLAAYVCGRRGATPRVPRSLAAQWKKERI